MFAASLSPLSIAPQELDAYLANGWFRMNQTIFTTHFLQFNKTFYNAVWLRVHTATYIPGPKHIAALKRIKHFRVEVRQARITIDHEILYEKYKEAVAFEAYTSLYQLLFGSYTHNIYNTKQVNIYDGEQLIATGFFDMGKTSAEGIVSIYDPAYRRYSLGKCLIYSKIDYCRQQGINYFYPGYAVPGYAAFDYKLDIAAEKLEYYNAATGHWVPHTTAQAMFKPLDEMCDRLQLLQNALQNAGVYMKLLYYRFFDAALNITLWPGLLGYPVFLLPATYKEDDALVHVIVYNIEDGTYVLTECTVVYSLRDGNEAPHIFSNNVLRVEKDVYANGDADQMAFIIAGNGNNLPGYSTG